MAVASHRIYVVSLGCPKNQVDTEVMLGQVAGAGHALVDAPEAADVIVVNTCAFIDAAKEESVDTILEMAEHKKAGVQKLIVTGCLAQRHAGELAEEIPEIDHILGSADFQGIAGVLGGAPATGARRGLPVIAGAGAGGGAPARVIVSETPAYIYDHEAPRVRIGRRHSAYVKIAEGCDRPCAFCIIPKLRGPQRSRRIDDVVAEARGLVAEGAKELNLIAQDLTRYGWDLGDTPETRPTLAALLEALGGAGAPWVRLHYTFPSAFDDALIDAIAREPSVVKYVDVPLQHIDDHMLKVMRRGHSSRVIRGLVDTLRARIPGVVLRTTFIVGHPGETDAMFDALCAFVEDARLDHVGVFPYSHEQGTVSAMLPHRVPPEVAHARRDHLMAIQQRISRARNEALVGRELEVLVDGVSGESDLLLEGRWSGQAPGVDGVVYLADGTAAPGDLVRARVTQASDYDLAASLEV